METQAAKRRLIVGTETSVSPTQTVVATITGNNGALVVNLPTNISLVVRQGVASGSGAGTPRRR